MPDSRSPARAGSAPGGDADLVRPRLLVLQHVACEPLGTFEAPLREAADVRVLQAYADPAAYRHELDRLVKTSGYDAVVALGGPMSVYEHTDVEFLDDSLRLLRDALHRELPILGICLGSQLLAWSLGAQVRAGRTLGLRKEIGWFPLQLTERGRVDPIFHGFREEEPVFHWHGDTYDIPEGAWHLARSARYPAQAFRWGRWAYGLQFHVEVTAALAAEWVEVYAAELAALDYVDGAAVVDQAARHEAALADKARVVAAYFVECMLESLMEPRVRAER